MEGLVDAVDRLAEETQLSGAVRVDLAGAVALCRAYGDANRACGAANTIDTRFAIASGVKGLTALTVVSLIEEGRLQLTTTARSLLGSDLPLIGDDVTVEHLLGHRSGIGDYVDEDAGHDIDHHVLPVPAHRLATTEQYVAVLDGHPPKFPAGARFAYCNSGYVVLALLAERATGVPFYDLVEQRICVPAGMRDTAFLRSDELPPRAAVGYLDPDGFRTNVLHLPVRGSGDGGIYTTVADIHALWAAVFGGRIVAREWVERMVQPRSHAPSLSMRYGLGFWLHESQDDVVLEGCDAGVSFRSVHDPTGRATHTVVSNTSRGAWPIARLLEELLAI